MIKLKYENNQKELGYLFWAFFSSLYSMLFYQEHILLLFLVVIQIGVLLICFLRGDLIDYLCYYIVFISTSLEYSSYYDVENVYGFKGDRFLGISISTWCLVPLLVTVYLNRKKWREMVYDKKNSSINFTVKAICFLIIIGIIVGLINLFVADNGLSKSAGVWGAFLKEIYSIFLYLVAPLYTFFYFIKVKQDYLYRIKKCLLAILTGIVLVQIIAVIFDIKGTTWDSPIIVISLLATFTPYLLLFYFSKKPEYSKNRYIYGILGGGGLIVSFKYTFSSGGLLIAMCVFLLILLMLYQQQQFKKFFLYIGVVAALSLLLVFVISQSNSVSGLFEYKLNQALAVFRIWDEDWLKNMPRSAKVRFIELYDIFVEYKEKPQYILFGKGVMGSVKDYSGLIKTLYEAHGSGFTDIEWRSDCYFSLHETFNILFLSNGLFGLVFFVYTLKQAVKGIGTSPFLGIGVAWFMFYYNYSMTLSMFGMCCLFVGLLDWDERTRYENSNFRFWNGQDTSVLKSKEF